MQSIVLAGGGTGGHVYPLLALADCLRRHDPQLRITCLGTPRGLERELIPPRGYDLRLVPAHPLPRKPDLDLLRTPDRVWRATRAARRILDEVSADALVGFGGYVAVPGYLAAWRRKISIVIHEINVPMGVANRLGARFTSHVAAGFPHQPAEVPALRDAPVVGVPLREAIATLDRGAARAQARQRFGLDPDRPTLFVSGGSQGARTINVAAAGAARALTDAGIQVLHVVGARSQPVPVPNGLAAPYVTLPYLAEMEQGYAAADLMLARGGAMTCAEVAAVGLPTVYVPYPHFNREQYRNVQPVVDAGGGLVVDNAELDPQWLIEHAIALLTDGPRLDAMSVAAAAYGRRDGADALRRFVLDAVRQDSDQPHREVA